MAIRIGSETSSYKSTLVIGIVTFLVILAFVYVFIYQSGIFIKKTVQPPQAIISAQNQLNEIQTQTQNLGDILSNPALKNSLRFGNLPLNPPTPGRNNPFIPY